jgi:hypothetical protein
MSNIQPPEELKALPLTVIKNMVMLATSGFGVVVGLAWNEAIKASVETYIDPFLGASSGVISLFIYAMLMTFLAVIVTMQLAGVERKLSAIKKPQLRRSAPAQKTKAKKKS